MTMSLTLCKHSHTAAFSEFCLCFCVGPCCATGFTHQGKASCFYFLLSKFVLQIKPF